MRTKYALKNLMTAWLGQVIIQSLMFVSRSIFVKVLSQEYLGVNGLFTNILTILSLAELGVGSAITFALYEPLAKNDEEKLRSLMAFYKKAYTVIGCVVAVLGAALVPFLNDLVKGGLNIPHIRLIFFMFVMDSATSYFFSYKAALITADQKKYIVNMNQNVFAVLKYSFRIAVLLLTRNYIVYLGVQLTATLLENITISRKADRLYPFLKEKAKPLSRGNTVSIEKNTYAMLLHKISGIVITSTDNLVISKFVGVVEVGVYSNYQLIVNSIQSVVGLILGSVVDGIGNFAVLEEKKKRSSLFYSLFFMEAWVFGFCSICLFCLFNPFILLWLGRDYLFSLRLVFIIAVNFYLTGMRQTALSFRDALGLFWYGKYQALAESALNLAVSLFLAARMGTFGVFLGTLVSAVAVGFWIEPYIVYKHGLEDRLAKYFIRFAGYALITFLAGCLTWFLCRFHEKATLPDFLRQLLICLSVPNLIFLAAGFRTPEFRYLKSTVSRNLTDRQ